MCNRCANVVLDQAIIERVIISGCVLEHSLVECRSLIP
jgi:hypothetical protein